MMWLIAFIVMGQILRALARLERRTQALESLLIDEPRCRVCRCTDEVACASGCWWVEDDLCSSCADDKAASSLESERG
ncbi:hypothetical protein LJR045_000950 [Microbacterium sp. LjRoot45]|uniref:hypothetical protein n=1 Tax=Microbacterium sp. LjRoot45 TaxID=3342329 RepID=UPI003ED0603E